jgi:hypothetical protein
MDGLAATLELLRPEEIPDALYFVDLMELVGHMDAAEAGEWRRRIQAWCRFGLRIKPAKANWRLPTTLLEEPDPFVS